MLMAPGLHKPFCAVHRERAVLLGDLVKDPGNEYLLGALVEYYGFGDQEAEVCTCGYDPVGHLAKMILADEDAPDGLFGHTVVYEALRPLLSDRTFRQLGAALELCPIHCTDIRTCLDDGLHGEEVYG